MGSRSACGAIPPAEDGRKQGADDFLKAKGKTAFKKLLRDALHVGAALPISDQVTLLVLNGSDVDMERTEFVWGPYIPKAKLCGVKGDQGGGKTTLLLTIAASLSRGRLPCSGENCEPVNTLYFSHENDPESQVLPRFVAAGGDTARLSIVTGAVDSNGKPRSFSLADTGALQSYLGDKVDMYRANETRPLLDGLMGGWLSALARQLS